MFRPSPWLLPLLLVACGDADVGDLVVGDSDVGPDLDGDGWGDAVDCDDQNLAIHPDAVELCNGVDDDCDARIDMDDAAMAGPSVVGPVFPDVDGDTYGVDAGRRWQCVPVGYGWSLVGGDCDDGDATVHPGAGCDAIADTDGGDTDGGGGDTDGGGGGDTDVTDTDGGGGGGTPVCGNHVREVGEACDDGNLNSGDGCDAGCHAEYCGDRIVQVLLGETCDDGNQIVGDGCNAQCGREYCGDGVIQGAAGEQCDDGNTNPGDGCGATCQIEACGNGVVGVDETCDDHNVVSYDGCSEHCQTERFDLVVVGATAAATDPGGYTWDYDILSVGAPDMFVEVTDALATATTGVTYPNSFTSPWNRPFRITVYEGYALGLSLEDDDSFLGVPLSQTMVSTSVPHADLLAWMDDGRDHVVSDGYGTSFRFRVESP